MPFLTNDPLPQCLQQSSAMGVSTLGGHERDVSAISLELSVSTRVPRVEPRTGAVTWAKLASPRFPSPLIKPDVRISRIRLSDWIHLEEDGRAPTWTWRSRSTPRSPNTTPSG